MWNLQGMEEEMRRKDREITDPKKIREIIDRCYCCRIGFCDQGEVYIVPLNFGYEEADGVVRFYFHGAKEGRKIGLIREVPEVGFELDTGYQLHRADMACGYSAVFQSVIGNGHIRIVEDLEEKKKGLALLMEHLAGEAKKGCGKRAGDINGGDGTEDGIEDETEDGRKGVEERTWSFSRESLDAVCVFRLDVEKLSCKEHL